MVTSYSGGRNRREPSTMGKQLINFSGAKTPKIKIKINDLPANGR
jgi:hypothetical protein